MKAVKTKEEPEFNVQKQYESKFKTKYQTMLLNMSKTLLHKITTEEDVNQQR